MCAEYTAFSLNLDYTAVQRDGPSLSQPSLKGGGEKEKGSELCFVHGVIHIT